MLKVTGLTCEMRKNPLGLDEPRPAFSWKLHSTSRDTQQNAYRIQVFRAGRESPIWDSGKVSARSCLLAPYRGPALEPTTRYSWRVRVWDARDRDSGYSDPAWWETGLMSPAGWKARWITLQQPGDVTAMQPAPYLKGEVRLREGVVSARVYASALGVYELYINGQRVGEDLFAPGWTSYLKRVQYQTYDVTELLREGVNGVGALLGDGWYRGNLVENGGRNHFGRRTALILQMQVRYRDGSEQLFITDERWKSTVDGPVRACDWYDGVVYDARREIPGWSCPGSAGGEWLPVTVLDQPLGVLTAQRDQPVRRRERLQPVQLTVTPKGETVLDFGQNMVGWVCFRISGPAGHTVRLRHAEVLDREGNFYTDNYRSARAEVSYTLSGAGEERFEPAMSFFGFRYVQLIDWPCPVKLSDFTGVVVHTAMEQTAGFECSDERVNQLWHNILWGQKGNFVDVPTDCPQRDERLGWTGDMQIFCRTALINMDSALMIGEWLRDLAADQRADGAVPYVVPQVLGKDCYGGAGWGDAAVIVPWTLYRCTGDVRVLERQYESMTAWVEYMRAQCEEPFLWTGSAQFGDWLGLDGREGDYSGATDKDYIATAFFAHSVDVMAHVAEVLGREADAMRYRALHKSILKHFRREFVTPNGRLSVPTQTAHVLALYFDLVEEHHKDRVLRDLVSLIHQNGDHLTTGFLGTPYLCGVLTAGGRHDVAAKVFLKTDFPSWLYPVSKGATTMWEHWDGIKPDGSFWSPRMNSFNHYAYGAIGQWMVRAVAGLDLSSPGYATLLMHPRLTDGLEFVSAWQETPYGRASCSWRRLPAGLEVGCQVPAGASAVLVLEGAALHKVTESERPLSEARGVVRALQSEGDVLLSLNSGEYTFTWPDA